MDERTTSSNVNKIPDDSHNLFTSQILAGQIQASPEKGVVSIPQPTIGRSSDQQLGMSDELQFSSPTTNFQRIQNSINADDELSETMEHLVPFEVPSVLINRGLQFLKISHKSRKKIMFWVDPVDFKLLYRQISKSSVHAFFVDDIRNVASKEEANHYREEFGISKDFERKWISITYFNHQKGRLKNLHLIADTTHDSKKFLHVLKNFMHLRDEINSHLLMNLKDLDDVKRSLISEKVEFSDKTQKQSLNFNEVLKYCRRLNINASCDYLKRIFKCASSCNDPVELDFKEFKTFVTLLTRRDDIESLWTSLVSNDSQMSFEIFSSFMHDVQKETDIGYSHKIYQRFVIGEGKGWSKEIFASFLHSKFCTTFTDEYLKDEYYSQPLNEYYILSSHNTYLIGRQFAGESSIEGYVKALQRGCRCIEIDLWNDPNNPGGEPIVNHGRTFSSGISFTNVLLTIKRFAFQITDFPLILSLEVHCSQKEQLVVVKILRDIFGLALVSESLSFDHTKLPSPNTLKGRILVKVKKTSTLGGPDLNRSSTTSTTGTSFSESNDSISSTGKSSFKIRTKTTSNVIDALSNLGIYCQGLKFRNFSLPESKAFNHCFSLSEKAVSAMLKDDTKSESLEKHNRRYLMRVYPSKFRVKSSNFQPITYWNHGVQMVATNWQTYDLGQQINESFFDKVHGRGYILKPKDLRKPILKSSKRNQLKRTDLRIRFSIKLISAHQLPRISAVDTLNPFVKLDIIGANSVDWSPSSVTKSTKIIPDNGFNPIWNELFSGIIQSYSELVFVRLAVCTSTSPAIIENPREVGISLGQLLSLKQGYRYHQLKDLCGETLLYSSLFMRIAYEII